MRALSLDRPAPKDEFSADFDFALKSLQSLHPGRNFTNLSIEVPMDSVAKWFDRKFEFTFPTEHFPNLCVRLRGTPARLEETLSERDRTVLIRKTAPTWSIQEHAGHLLDLEPLWFARAEDFLSDAHQLTAADLRNQKTHEANHNGRPLADILADFRAARMRLVERLATIPDAAFSRTILHPRLKQPMRMVDHLFFAAEHDDHHLAKIQELLQQR